MPAPRGWSDAADQLRESFFWAPQGPGTSTVADYGLTDASQLKGRLIKTPEGGRDLYVFTYGSTPYFWNMISDEIFKVTQPADYPTLLAEMGKQGGMAKVKMEQLMDAPDET